MINLKKLKASIRYSRDKLQPYRERRFEAIQQYCGSNYGGGLNESVPLPYIEMAASIYVQNLIGNAPRAYTSTVEPELKGIAENLKYALDETIEATGLEKSLWECALDALFGWGIMKVGITGSSPGEAGNIWNGAGEPFAVPVDQDDWVVDMTAKAWRNVAYCGNRYRIPLHEAQADPRFEKSLRKKLKPTYLQNTNETGDERVDTIGRGQDTNVEELQDQIELWDIFLPLEKKLITFEADNENPEALAEVKWKGPLTGPYPNLGFFKVPGQLVPLPPVAMWKDIHDLANQLYLKLGRQALRQKSILPIRGGNSEDADAIRESADGGIIRVDSEVPDEVSYGGPSNVNMAFFLTQGDHFNRHAGNPEMLGGLDSSAETLGQEQMRGKSASQRFVFMQRKLTIFVDEILTGYQHYLFTDPLVNMKFEKRRPGSKTSIVGRWNRENRGGSDASFRVKVQPYSLEYTDPQLQFKKIMEFVTGVAMNVNPEMVATRIEELTRMAADMTNTPELLDLFYNAVPQARPGEGGGGKPNETTRNYTRTSIPGSSNSQKANALAQALMGSAPQDAEMATIGR
jgi:hypothetical protein